MTKEKGSPKNRNATAKKEGEGETSEEFLMDVVAQRISGQNEKEGKKRKQFEVQRPAEKDQSAVEEILDDPETQVWISKGIPKHEEKGSDSTIREIVNDPETNEWLSKNSKKKNSSSGATETTPEGGRASNIPPDPDADVTQAQRTSLTRQPPVSVDPAQGRPGAYSAAPGTNLERNNTLRFSLLGNEGGDGTARDIAANGLSDSHLDPARELQLPASTNEIGSNREEDILLEAQLVEEGGNPENDTERQRILEEAARQRVLDEMMVNATTAVPVDEDAAAPSAAKRLCMFGGVGVVLIGIITLVLYFTLSGAPPKTVEITTTSTPTHQPSSAPTGEPTQQPDPKDCNDATELNIGDSILDLYEFNAPDTDDDLHASEWLWNATQGEEASIEPVCYPDEPFGGAYQVAKYGHWYRLTGSGELVTLKACSNATPADEWSVTPIIKTDVYTDDCEGQQCVSDFQHSELFDLNTSCATVSWSARTGADYSILVYASDPWGGLDANDPFWISVDLPFNNICEQAVAMGKERTSLTGSIIFDALAEDSICDPSLPGAWYFVRGTGSVLTVTTCGSIIPTNITVYKGSTCGGLECVEDAVDTPCGQQSRLAWVSTRGETYYIHVTSTNVGQFSLQVLGTEFVLLADNDVCLSAESIEFPLANNVTVPVGFSSVDPGLSIMSDVACALFGGLGPAKKGVWYKMVGTGEALEAFCPGANTLWLHGECGQCTIAAGCSSLGCVTVWDFLADDGLLLWNETESIPLYLFVYVNEEDENTEECVLDISLSTVDVTQGISFPGKL